MTGGDSFHLLTFVPTPEYIHNPTEAFSQIAMKGTSRCDIFHIYFTASLTEEVKVFPWLSTRESR